MQNVYLAQWADFNDAMKNHPEIDPNTGIWLGVYGFIGFFFSLSVVTQVIFVWIYCGIRSARVLHMEMLKSIVRLPQSFFDTTPLGRILNRFSKDQYTVDEILPRTFQGYFRTLFSVISVLAVNALGNPYYLLLALPLGILYSYFQKFYLSTSRELKRLDSTSKSPIFAHFQETLGGVSTIRAYKSEARFIQTNEYRVDFNQKAYYPSISSNRWLAVRLEFIGALVVFGSAMFGVITILVNGSIPASIIGLMLTYSLSITQTLNWMVRQSCEIETNIVSVERIKEYTDLPQEADYTNDYDLPANWPASGSISFQSYGTRYRDNLDLVLNVCLLNS
jgi:ABC-type multidrug transport system fused ATPase/permease subunit